MSDGRDQADGMRPDQLDELTAEQLLAGAISPDDAPAGWAPVARLVASATGPEEPAEVVAEASVVAAMVDAIIGESDVVPMPTRRRFSRFRTTKAAGLAVAVVLTSATAAAAATGSLPGPAQTAVSDAASHVGVSLPRPGPTPPPDRGDDHDADDTPAAHTAATPGPTGGDHSPSTGERLKTGAASTAGSSTSVIPGSDTHHGRDRTDADQPAGAPSGATAGSRSGGGGEQGQQDTAAQDQQRNADGGQGNAPAGGQGQQGIGGQSSGGQSDGHGQQGNTPLGGQSQSGTGGPVPGGQGSQGSSHGGGAN